MITFKTDNKDLFFPAYFFIHIFQFSWLLLPDFAYLFYNQVSLAQGCGLLLLTFALLSLVTLVTDSWKAFYLINIPLAFLSGLIAAYIFTFKIPITIGLVYSILNTDLMESLEVIQRYFIWVIASLLGFTLYIYFTIFKIKSKIILKNYMAVFGVIGLFIIIFHQYIIFEIHERFNFVLNRVFITQSYPYNIIDTIKKVIIDKQSKNFTNLIGIVVCLPCRSGSIQLN